MSKSEYLIGIDIGTQGTKAALFNTDMDMLCSTTENSKLISPEPGIVWQEPDDLYFSCARTINTLIESTGINPDKIAAIGIDGQMAGIMGIDENGEAATYYDSWLDVRSSSYVDMMREKAGDELVALSGGQVTCNHASKMLWWKNEYPEIYIKTAKFVLPHGYIVGKMTGNKADKAVFDYTCLHFNSFSDNKNKTWSKEMLDLFGIDFDKLPRIASPFEVFGYTTEAFAKLSGTVSGIPVVVGAGDTAASTFGSGMFDKNLVMDCAGTASVMCCVVDNYLPDLQHKTLTMMRSPVDGLWLPLSYINGGGLCLRWFRDNFAGNPQLTYDALEAEAEKVPAGSEKLLFCPHFSGRVLPEDSSLKGSFMGLDFRHTRAHLYRAVMEGIAYEYSYYLRVIREDYPNGNFDNMYTIGGGANSRLFNQIKADVLNVSVHTFESGETALIGSAVIAAVGAKVFDDYKEPIRKLMKKKGEFKPEPCNVRTYIPQSEAYGRMLDVTSRFYKQYSL